MFRFKCVLFQTCSSIYVLYNDIFNVTGSSKILFGDNVDFERHLVDFV